MFTTKINLLMCFDIYVWGWTLHLCVFQANSEASLGKYVAGSVEGKAADAGLFVKNHAY